jgi:hypothetical protein
VLQFINMFVTIPTKKGGNVMNQSLIAEMKANIQSEYEAKISRLQDEMNTAIDALSKVEETLFASNIISNELPASIKKKIPMALEQEPNTARPLSIRSRIIKALNKMGGEFTTRQLRDAVNSDGTGKEVKKNGFAPEFTRLKKNNLVIVIQEQQGNQPGKYKKAEEIKTQAASSPAMQEGVQ